MNTTERYNGAERGGARNERRPANGQVESPGIARNFLRAIIVLFAALILSAGCASQAPLSSGEYYELRQKHIQTVLEASRRRSEAVRRKVEADRLHRQRLVSIAVHARWAELRRVIEGAKSGRKESL